MTNFPPPRPGDRRPPPNAPIRPRRGRTAALIGGVVALVALGAGGVLIATRDHSPGRVLPRNRTSTSEPDTTDSVPPQTAPVPSVQITLPPTTTAPPTTSVAPDTSVVVPDGAVDLGYGVYFPMPAGWKVTDVGPDNMTTIGNEETSLTLQAQARPPGVSPQTVLQEYIDRFDGAVDAVSYNPSEHYPRIEGPMAIDDYGVTYRFFDASDEDGIPTTGLAAVYIRTDGLTVIHDIWSHDDVYTIDDDSFGEFAFSMRDAPALGDTVVMQQYQPFRVTSVHEFVPAFGLAGYTVAPGWTSSTRPDGNLMVSNEDATFEMRRHEAVGSVDAAVQAASAYELSLHPSVTFDAPIVGTPNFYGHERRDVYWRGRLADGTTPIRGVFTVFYDSKSGNSVAMYEDWFGAIPKPHRAEFSFMFTTAADSFASI